VTRYVPLLAPSRGNQSLSSSGETSACSIISSNRASNRRSMTSSLRVDLRDGKHYSKSG
jgi:hypothetical protein